MAKKAAIYCRISTQMQSSDRQEEELRAYALREGYEIVDVYKDVISGFKEGENRPSFENLMHDSEQHKFEIILFSEFTRLSRRVNDLTSKIEYFRKLNIDLYFQKQNRWVGKEDDLGTRILIQVLGVICEYEIELFAERSISGKISALNNRNINIGGFAAYGYFSEPKTKALCIHPIESEVVKRIFNDYAEGKSQQKICDILNAEKTPCPYSTRVKESQNKRLQKGLNKKQYSTFDEDSLVWRPASLNKLLKNRLYTGLRKITFHAPDPTNPTKASERQNRQVIQEYSERIESLRIIDEATFESVQSRLIEKRTNKEISKEPSLLKNLTKCGICGRNFAVGGDKERPIYRCFGNVKDVKTQQIFCKDSKHIEQSKLDGLVVQLSISVLTEELIKTQSEAQITTFGKEIEELKKIVAFKQNELATINSNWNKYIKLAVTNEVEQSYIDDEKQKYLTQKSGLENDISINNQLITKKQVQIKGFQKVRDNNNFINEQFNLKANTSLLKELMYQWIKSIEVLPLFDKYSLVIIEYHLDLIVYATIKSARYRNDEMFFDEYRTFHYQLVAQFYQTKVSEPDLTFNKQDNTFQYLGGGSYMDGVEAGIYEAKKFIEILKKQEWSISFDKYFFREKYKPETK